MIMMDELILILISLYLYIYSIRETVVPKLVADDISLLTR